MTDLPRCADAMAARAFEDVVRTMALHHEKWDAQVGDVAAMARFPLVLSKPAWARLASMAASLARETVAMEAELSNRPELWSRLGLPRALDRALRPRRDEPPTPGAARIMRFDFHPTEEGWRVSEVNSDVPGGFTESSRFAELVAKRTGAGAVAGDAGNAWMTAVAGAAGADGAVVLVSAPGWLEDTQVVTHLAARLRDLGIRAYVASPHHLRWVDGRAYLRSDFGSTRVDAVVRFYQAEWVAELACRDSWTPLFRGGRIPVSNAGTAALTESKRLPLLWSELDSPSVAWRSAVPPTFDPREAGRALHGDWVLKPAFGNTGDGIALRRHMSPSEWVRRLASALLRPRRWVLQQRFRSLPLESPMGPVHACVGVYVVDGRVAGAYGRISPTAFIDHCAIDTAVLVET
jgi:glutathionylspermidine synthase